MSDTAQLESARMIRLGCSDPGCDCGNTPHFIIQFSLKVDLENTPKEGQEGNPLEIARVYDLAASELASHASKLREGKVDCEMRKIDLEG